MIGRSTGIATSLLLLALILPTVSVAGPYEDGDAAFNRKDYAEAMRRWYPLAESGHAQAQSRLAALYYGGHGVALSYEHALMWCQKAADQGDGNALYMLGAMYRDGKGVERDAQKAMVLFLKASNQDVPGAQYGLGLMYMTGEAAPPDYVEAYYWLGLAAAAAGEDHSQLRTTAAYVRDEAGAKLSADQLADAKRRIDERKIAQKH